MSSHRKSKTEHSKMFEELKQKNQETINDNQVIKENVEKILSYLKI
jgi:hypothetical protein